MRLKTLAACLLLPVVTGVVRADDRGDGYLGWAESHGLVGMLARPEADLDGDGITNLMAYAFDLAPVEDPDAWERLPSLAFVGDPPEPIISFVLPRDVPTDVSYVVEMVTGEGKSERRVEIARKDGRGPWRGQAELFRHRLPDGTTEISVEAPLDLVLPEDGAYSLKLRVEFMP